MIMQQKVNYILHLNQAFQRMNADRRLSPYHISLYYSLFQYWNISKFRNPISISRDDQMQASKIGSVNTYLKSLKELHHWGYIKYEPSHNPMKGSLVYLFNFDTTDPTTKHITINTTNQHGNNNSSHTTDQTTLKKQVRPSINTLNNTKKTNKKNEYGHTRKKSNPKSDQSVTRLFKSEPGNTGKEKSSAKKEKSRQSRPLLLAVREHFIANTWPEPEAQKFFAHYQSNGWMVGKVPMQDWKASAEKWMLNNKQFTNGKEKLSAGKLNASTGKDYSEPL